MATHRLVRPCVVVLAACMILLSSPGSFAQEKKAGDIILPQIGSGSVDAYIEALKSDIRNSTRKIIEVNMQLTEKEAALFWPIYNRYDYDISKVNFERASIYEFYADNYKTLSDEQAQDIIKRFDHVERWRLSLDEKYSREMAKVLPMRTVLRFLQISRQVDRLVSLKIMAGTPLVPKEPSGAKPKAER